MRPCLSALEPFDQRNKQWALAHPQNIHYIVSTTATAYMEWQARYSYYWFKKTQPLTSFYTRLLAAEEMDHLGGEIPTYLTQHFNMTEDNYSAYNKPSSIVQWLEAGNPKNADIVAVMDVDIIMLEDLSHFAVGVQEGSPLSQNGFMWFTNTNSSFDKLAEEFCDHCETVDSLAVPIYIHKNDLRKIAPRWLSNTRKIRDVTKHGLNVKKKKSGSFFFF